MSRRITQLRLKLRSVFLGTRVDEELDEEIQDHLEREIAARVRAGLDPKEARFAALREMGAIGKHKEESRDARGVRLIEDFRRDVQYAVRSLGRRPGFTALVVGIMALGIGANTAVFSVVDAVLLKPLPYADPDRIVMLAGDSDGQREQVTLADAHDWNRQAQTFEAIATYLSFEFAVSPGDVAEYGTVALVDQDFFRVFGVVPALGRTFTDEEMLPEVRAAVISHGYWQSRFGRDAGVLRRTIRVGSNTWTIVGVLPPGFAFPGKTDVWVPQKNTPSRTNRSFLAAGRLKPGVSLEQAQSEMSAIAARLERQYPESNQGRGVAVAPLRDQLVGPVDRLTLYLLWGVVGVVLLIACANTATLLLGKAMARAREVAMRAALGASRSRIVRQLTAESLLLALLAGACGLLLASWGAQGLAALVPSGLPANISVDGDVLAFTLGVTLVTSLLFGMLPALHASRVDLNGALKQVGARATSGSGIVRTRGLLVVFEIALAVLLLTGAGLLTKSLLALHSVKLGYQPENVLVMRATGVRPIAQNNAFFREMLARTAETPGVIAAGAAMTPPGNWDTPIGSGPFFPDRRPENRDRRNEPQALMTVVTPGVFAALGIPLRAGRDFDNNDTLDRPMVVIVNEALARAGFGGENPIGRTLYCSFDRDDAMTIVGVVADVRQLGPSNAPSPICYLPYRQHSYNNSTLSIVARTAGDPTALAGTLRKLAAEISAEIPVDFTTMEESDAANIAEPQFRALLFAAFAGLAVCLALAGVYGVMAYSVGQRSSEIGLRIALGATAGSVLRLVLRQGLLLAGLGLALGLLGAVAATRLLGTVLFEVEPLDAQVYLAVALLLFVVTLLAGYVPAKRASRIDPAATLRGE